MKTFKIVALETVVKDEKGNIYKTSDIEVFKKTFEVNTNKNK
jgi:hypothetical protein